MLIIIWVSYVVSLLYLLWWRLTNLWWWPCTVTIAGGQQNIAYVLPGEASEPWDVESDNSLTLLASCTAFIVVSLESARPMNRSLAVSAHFPGWQMMLQWVQQLLPGEWTGCGLSLTSVLLRALCSWQSYSLLLILLLWCRHSTHYACLHFPDHHWFFCYCLCCFLDLCFTSQNCSFLI